METSIPLPVLMLIASLFGCMCAYVAKKTDKNPIIWFAIGAFFGVFGLLAILYLTNKTIRSRQLATASVEIKKEIKLPHKMWYYLDADQKQYGPVSSFSVHQELKDKKIDLFHGKKSLTENKLNKINLR